MTKIIIAGAGGAPSEGVINSLLRSNKKETIIGIGSEPTDLVLSNAHEKYYVPYANTPHYKDALLTILKTLKPDLIHFQNDDKPSLWSDASTEECPDTSVTEEWVDPQL